MSENFFENFKLFWKNNHFGRVEWRDEIKVFHMFVRCRQKQTNERRRDIRDNDIWHNGTKDNIKSTRLTMKPTQYNDTQNNNKKDYYNIIVTAH